MSSAPRTTAFDLLPEEELPPYFRADRVLPWCAALVFAGLHPGFEPLPQHPSFPGVRRYEARRERDACVRETRHALEDAGVRMELRALDGLSGSGREVWPLQHILHTGNAWAHELVPQVPPWEIVALEEQAVHAISTAIYYTDPRHIPPFSGSVSDIRTQLFFEAASEIRSVYHSLRQLTIDRRPTHRIGWVEELRLAAYGTSALLRMQILLCMGQEQAERFQASMQSAIASPPSKGPDPS